MRIVSDTSCLIILKKIDALWILEEIFKEVLIPEEVKRELYKKEKKDFENVEYIRVVNADEKFAKIISIYLDRGEAEAISIAFTQDLPLIIDDLKGRKFAENLGIKYIGTLGILKIAKNKGIIKRIKPFIDKLLERGYYLDEKLIGKFLKEIGE